MGVVDRIQRGEEEVAYLDTLARNITADVQRETYKFAVRCCYGLQRCGVRVDQDLATNLVADAISDTANVTRRWRPEQCTLGQHLRGVIRSRISILAEHQRRFPKVELAEGAREHGAIFVADPRSGPDFAMMRDLARRVLTPLYRAANNNEDQHLVRVLDAYAQGITKLCAMPETMPPSIA